MTRRKTLAYRILPLGSLILFCGCARGTTDNQVGTDVVEDSSQAVGDDETISVASFELTTALSDACPRLGEAKIVERINSVITRKSAGDTLEEQQVFWSTPPLQCDTDELCPGFLTDSCPPCQRCWQAVVLHVYSAD